MTIRTGPSPPINAIAAIIRVEVGVGVVVGLLAVPVVAVVVVPLVGVRALHPAGTVLVAPVTVAVVVVAIACFDSILVPVVGVGVGVGVEAGGEAGHVRRQVQFCEQGWKQHGRLLRTEAPFANGLPYFAAIRSRKSTFGTGLFTLFGALDVQ